MDGLGEFF